MSTSENMPRSVSRSLLTFPAGRRAKWIVFAVWLVGIMIATGPANLPAKFQEAEDNESTSFLPGDAESTAALKATEELQGGELASAVIVYRRADGLTPADFQQIQEDVKAMTAERFPSVIADGATAAAGGESGEPAESQPAPQDLPPGCSSITTPVPGQPADYAPFLGPLCAEDGKAAILIAYLEGNGEGESITDPVTAWRDVTNASQGDGLEVKITGGAGYAADAIAVFENINGTLLLAALSLVVFLLIVIYRSPMFFLIPLVSVLFAEALSRSLGYGVSEIGFTVNGQSSSIMSVLVLGAGTDYALLLVSRYREELHHTADRHEAMRVALSSAGPAILASAATAIAALLCLMIADVNGTAGLGPIGALGIFCAALSMLTLLPALLTIFGRRAFWPFVPHTPETAPAVEGFSERGREIVDGGGFAAGLKAVLASLAVLVLLPLVILNWLLRVLSGRRIPSLIVGNLDRTVFTPYEARRRRLERASDATHGLWKRVGDRVAAGPRRVMTGTIAVLLVCCAGFAFFSTDLTENEAYREDVESVEGQELLDLSFPAGASAPTNIIVPSASEAPAVRQAVAAVDGVQAVTPPVAEGEPGVLLEATLKPDPYSTAALDLVEPIREAAHSVSPETLVGGATAVQYDVREAAARDSTVIPPIVLVVVFLILVLLLRALVAPLILIGTVILSFLAALGVGYFFFDVVFGFPGSDPSLPLYAFVFLVALGVDYNIFLIARAREETEKHGSEQGILRALAVTGTVITSAGIVLAGTFSVLAVLPLVFLTELGFVVAFGVLLDTFIVRSVLVPAIALVAGDRFWWPSALSRGEGSPNPKDPSPAEG